MEHHPQTLAIKGLIGAAKIYSNTKDMLMELKCKEKK